MVLAMAEIFALLLGEIDLSIGYVGAVGAAIAVQLVQPATTNWPWWAAIIVSLLACALIGAAQGTLITRLRLPSFIVTLAGLLIFNGVLLIVLAFGPFSGYPSLTGSQPNLRALYNLMWGHISPTEGWIVMAVLVGALGLNLWLRDAPSTPQRPGGASGRTHHRQDRPHGGGGHRRRGGVQRQPCRRRHARRGPVGDLHRPRRARRVDVPAPAHPLRALHLRHRWQRRGGPSSRHQGRPASARGPSSCARSRPGSPGCSTPRTSGGMSNNVNGGQLVLYAVAAAVIGGTSLFGGRGKAVHGVLGGLVIGGIYNGMYLLGPGGAVGVHRHRGRAHRGGDHRRPVAARQRRRRRRRRRPLTRRLGRVSTGFGVGAPGRPHRLRPRRSGVPRPARHHDAGTRARERRHRRSPPAEPR